MPDSDQNTTSSGSTTQTPSSGSTTTSGGTATNGGTSTTTTSGGTTTTGGTQTTSNGGGSSSGNTTSGSNSSSNTSTTVSNGATVTEGVPMADGTPVPAGDTNDVANVSLDKQDETNYTSNANNGVSIATAKNTITDSPTYVTKDRGILNTTPDISIDKSPVVLVPDGETSLNFVVRDDQTLSVPIVIDGVKDTLNNTNTILSFINNPPSFISSIDPLSMMLRVVPQMPTKVSGAFTAQWTMYPNNYTGNSYLSGYIHFYGMVLPSLKNPKTYTGQYTSLTDPKTNNLVVTDSSMNLAVMKAYVTLYNEKDPSKVWPALEDFTQKCCRYTSNEGLFRLWSFYLGILNGQKLDDLIKNAQAALGRNAASQIVCLLKEINKIGIQKLPLSRVDAPEIIRQTRSQRIVGFIQQQAQLNHR